MEDWMDFEYRQMSPVTPLPSTPQAAPYIPPLQYPYTPQPIAVPQPIPISPPLDTTKGPDFEMEPGAPVQQNIEYTQGYLRTQIGERVRIEFLIGTNITTDRIGTLLEVGISYVVIQPVDSDDLLLCDIYSIKFVTIYK